MGAPNGAAPHHRVGDGRRDSVELLGNGLDRSHGSSQLENQHWRSYSDAEIARARAIDIADVAAARGLKLKRQGRELVGPCPRCGEGRDRFAIHVGKQLFHCRGCGGRGGGAIDLMRFLDGCSFIDAVEALTGLSGGHDCKSGHHRRSRSTVYNDDADNHDRASAIWRQARAPEGTPVEKYLKRRGLSLPSSEVIRYHPACPFGGRKVPAMVALVRNIVTNEPQAVHRTSLDLNGNKVALAVGGDRGDRMSLGPIKGGAVKLTDDAEVTKALGTGEGIETTLSLQLRPEWFGSPVWSLLDAGGLRHFPVLPGVETLFVAVDHDKLKQGQRAGQEAATEVSARWLAAGREVLLGWSTAEGEDLNDLLTGGDHV